MRTRAENNTTQLILFCASVACLQTVKLCIFRDRVRVGWKLHVYVCECARARESYTNRWDEKRRAAEKLALTHTHKRIVWSENSEKTTQNASKNCWRSDARAVVCVWIVFYFKILAFNSFDGKVAANTVCAIGNCIGSSETKVFSILHSSCHDVAGMKSTGISISNAKPIPNTVLTVHNLTHTNTHSTGTRTIARRVSVMFFRNKWMQTTATTESAPFPVAFLFIYFSRCHARK